VAGPPTGLTATPHSGHVDLAWTNNSVYSSLQVQRKVLGGAYANVGTQNVDDESYQDDGAFTTTTYYWKIVTNLGNSNEVNYTFTAWTSDNTDTISLTDWSLVGYHSVSAY